MTNSGANVIERVIFQRHGTFCFRSFTKSCAALGANRRRPLWNFLSLLAALQLRQRGFERGRGPEANKRVRASASETRGLVT